MKIMRFHVLEWIEHNILLAEHDAAGDRHIGVRLLQQRTDDVQRVGQNLQIQRFEIGTHL